MDLYLGIDGGQSSTVAFIGDAVGRVIGAGRDGPCNHVSGVEAAAKLERVIGNCIAQACGCAGLDANSVSFQSVCCGLSGGPHDKREILSRMIRTDRLLLKTDGEIALTGALRGTPGIVVIAGTGSIAFGRDEAGRVLRAGGWGYVFGDEGGAFDIVRQALRACLRFEEGWGRATALRTTLLAATEAASAAELMHCFYTPDWPRARVAALSARVDAVSAMRDVVAREILEQAGQKLAALANCLRTQLFPNATSPRVSYIGGVFRSAAVLEMFQRVTESDGCQCLPPLLDPAAGALLEAYSAAGVNNVALSDVPALK